MYFCAVWKNSAAEVILNVQKICKIEKNQKKQFLWGKNYKLGMSKNQYAL